MRYLAILAVLVVTACGVDGPPVAPGAATPEPGLGISGEARIGVVTSV